ncbi:sigma factor [Sphaerisporangium sp. NPDC088356]|uniref:RNA polymerase sigma factor n=1 Tax=Sphaerisporangium sp. NPDC088356 TaxID=3154871 RepID=UPI0034474B0B
MVKRRRDQAPVGPHSDDAELLAAVAAGRVEALRTLHARPLRVRLTRRCADPDLVADAIQDTSVILWQGARRYRAQEADAAAWIWTIAIRKLISIMRRSGASPHSSSLDDGRTAGAYGTRHPESAEDVLLVAVEHGDLGTALARLSPDLRAAIQATVLAQVRPQSAQVATPSWVGFQTSTIQAPLAKALSMDGDAGRCRHHCRQSSCRSTSVLQHEQNVVLSTTRNREPSHRASYRHVWRTRWCDQRPDPWSPDPASELGKLCGATRT